MKKWIFAFRVQPPPHTVSARHGGSVFFAWHSRFLRQWYLVAGSYMEKIDPPQMLFVSEEYAREHPSTHFADRPGKPLRLRKKKCEQLSLF